MSIDVEEAAAALRTNAGVFSGMGYLFGDEPSGEFMEDWSNEIKELDRDISQAAVEASKKETG